MNATHGTPIPYALSRKESTDPRAPNITSSSSTNFPHQTISILFKDEKAVSTDPRIAKETGKYTNQSRTLYNITSFATSCSSYAALTPLSFITEMIQTEPKRQEYAGENGWMYRAMSQIWDGGERVLRSIRIRAREMNDATRSRVKQFFAPLFTFTVAYTNVRLPSAVIEELKTKAEEFEQALEQMNNVECVV